MMKAEHVQAIGQAIAEIMGEYVKAEKDLPAGFSPSEVTLVFDLTAEAETLAGEWEVVVRRPER